MKAPAQKETRQPDPSSPAALGAPDRRSDRERIVAGIGKAVTEQGHAKLAVEDVLRYAGVSRETYEAQFATTEQGVLAAQEAFIERLWLEIVSACEIDRAWILNVRAALSAGLAYIGEASELARVFAVEAAASSMAVNEQQFVALDRFATLLQGGRDQEGVPELPPMTERVLIGGIVSVVTARLLSEDAQGLEDLEPELTELVLVFYLGRDEARALVRG